MTTKRVLNHGKALAFYLGTIFFTTALHAQNYGPVLGARIVDRFSDPQQMTSSTVVFEFKETPLNPGEALQIDLPIDSQQYSIEEVSITHRQRWHNRQPANPGDQDPNPGITSVLVRDAKDPDLSNWKYWAGPASGDYGGKFAEVRSGSNPEVENLYQWSHIGFHRLEDGVHQNYPLSIDQIRLVNTGSDVVWVSRTHVKFRGTTPAHVDDQIFTPGTSFGDTHGGGGKHLGGGIDINAYPQALKLYPRRDNRLEPRHEIPTHWSFSEGIIHIPVSGMVSLVELAVGDIHTDEPPQKGLPYAPGGAQISIGISSQSHPQDIQWFVDHENVPPEGFVFGSPKNIRQINPGAAMIHIKSSQDPTYIMGVRIGFAH